MASDKDAILMGLERVLEPLGDERKAELLELAGDYLETVPAIEYLYAKAEAGDAIVYEFRVGNPNPLHGDPNQPDAGGPIVFAIFPWYAQGHAYVVYSFIAAPLEDGGALGRYLRDVVYEPRFVCSRPMADDALFSDLRYHLEQSPWDDVEEQPQAPEDGDSPNGAAVRALAGSGERP